MENNIENAEMFVAVYTHTHGDIYKKRVINLDIARTLAIISVLLCHAVELIYNMKPEGWIDLSRISKIFRTITFTVGRLGVPIFLFLTGYLLLSKKYNDDGDVKKFYKKNLLPIVLVTEIWIIIYNIFIPIYYKLDFDLEVLIKEMLFFKNVPLMNMWYMPMIIGVYLVIPYLSKIVNSFSIKTLKFPIILGFVLVFILPSLDFVLKVCKLEQYVNILDISFLGGIYGLHIVIGYELIYNKKLRKMPVWLILITSIISFAFGCGIQFFGYSNKVPYNIWYNSPFTLICSLCIFELCMRINIEKLNSIVIKMFTYISKISLAMYFLHIIVEMILRLYIRNLMISNPIKVVILFITSTIITVLIIWLISKIKVIREKVLLIKQ